MPEIKLAVCRPTYITWKQTLDILSYMAKNWPDKMTISDAEKLEDLAAKIRQIVRDRENA